MFMVLISILEAKLHDKKTLSSQIITLVYSFLRRFMCCEMLTWNTVQVCEEIITSNHLMFAVIAIYTFMIYHFSLHFA